MASRTAAGGVPAMKWLPALTALLPLGCAVAPGNGEAAPAPIQVLTRSHNRSDVDVYLLCGDHDAEWLGVVPDKGAATFEIPAGRSRCVPGLNFFLVVQRSGRGYWVGPLRRAPRPFLSAPVAGAPRGNTSGVALLRARRRPMHAPVAHHH